MTLSAFMGAVVWSEGGPSSGRHTTGVVAVAFSLAIYLMHISRARSMCGPAYVCVRKAIAYLGWEDHEEDCQRIRELNFAVQF
jgi:hypothetical protein